MQRVHRANSDPCKVLGNYYNKGVWLYTIIYYRHHGSQCTQLIITCDQRAQVMCSITKVHKAKKYVWLFLSQYLEDHHTRWRTFNRYLYYVHNIFYP